MLNLRLSEIVTFWENNVLARLPPPYLEDDGDLILESLQRALGPADKDAPPVSLNKAQSARVTRFLELFICSTAYRVVGL